MTTPRRDSSSRAALVTFVLMLAFTAVAVPTWLGNRRWFDADEWDFIVARRLSDVGGLFEPHNEHWVTVPAVMYRLLYRVVGLHHYWPYQLLVVAAHLSVVVLLRVVMRRAGVGPWIATVVAGSLLLLGSGMEDIVWGFQITFVGAFALGLVHLILADHDDGIDGRDWVGLAAGALALGFSGIAVIMAVVVALAVLLRRGWRIAVFHTAPLAAVYATWWLVVRPPSGMNPTGAGLGHIATTMVSFVARGAVAAFGGIGYFAVLGAALMVLVAVGLVVAWRPLGWRRFRLEAAPVAALLVGFALFLLQSAYGRWWAGAGFAEQSRLVYLSVAFLLPAVGVAADAVGRRWPAIRPAVLVLLVVGLLLNLRLFVQDDRFVGPQFDRTRAMATALADSPIGDQVPGWVEVDPRSNRDLTIGFLRSARVAGDLPAGRPPDDELAASIPVRLGIAQTAGPAPTGSCRLLTEAVELRPVRGDTFGFSGGLVGVSPVDGEGLPTAPPLRFATNHGDTLEVMLDGLHVAIGPGVPDAPVTLCR